jgi:NAD-dependent SIR2 family protein deacetylase
MSLPGGVMTYVVCKHCGDPVAGKMPSGDEARVLTCVHCKETFEFDDSELRRDIVIYDSMAKRWRVEGLAAMIKRQAESTRKTPIGRSRRR